MNKLFYSILVLSLLIIGCKAASSNLMSEKSKSPETIASEKQITQTIETYFEGWMTGDTTLLGKAMHRTCQLKNIKDDDVIIYDRATYLGLFKPRERRQNAGGSILSIDITDDIASAKCRINTADRLYTDYFNMMKVNDQWYIVDKIATNKLRNSN